MCFFLTGLGKYLYKMAKADFWTSKLCKRWCSISDGCTKISQTEIGIKNHPWKFAGRMLFHWVELLPLQEDPTTWAMSPNLTLLPLFVWCAVHLLWSYRLKQKPKVKPFQTDENEIKTHTIPVMLFCFVFLCLYWRFKACESDVFKIMVSATVILKTVRVHITTAFTQKLGILDDVAHFN